MRCVAKNDHVHGSFPFLSWMSEVTWLRVLLAQPLSESSDRLELAVLAVWKQAVSLSTDESRVCLARELTELPPKCWRRLGRLVFASDIAIVRALLSMLDVITDESSLSVVWKPLCHRVWSSEWRQCLQDKLTDCHDRVTSGFATASSVAADTTLCLRLVRIFWSLFRSSIDSDNVSPRDQVTIFELLSSLVASPVTKLACLATQTLRQLLEEGHRLDPNVLAFVVASDLYPTRLASLSSQSESRGHRRDTTVHQLEQTLRIQTLKLLLTASALDTGVATALATDHRVLLSVVETVLLCEDEVLQALVLRLLVAVLRPSTDLALMRTIRLSGLLITLAWMLGHSSTAVQTEALRVYQCVRELSSPSDLVRVMIEQGCVVVLYLVVDSPSSDGKELLQWVVSELEGQPQLLEWGLDSVAHSTNARLQRNILLSLLFLSHSSVVVRSATTEIEEVLKASLTTSEDNTLVMGVLAAATLSCDPRSTVRLDAVSMTRSASTGQLPTQSTGETLRAVRLVCRDGTVCYSGSQYDLLVAHCKQLRRLVLIQTAGTVLCVDLTALETTKSTVELLVAILKQPEQRDAMRFVHAHSTVDSVTLLRLSKSLDCLKGWHTATLGLTMALDSRNWIQTLDDALLLRHPALMLRTLRFVLSHPEALDSDNMTREPLERATMRIWDELRANCV